ncbi:MAG: flagellar basal body P-ring formation protein FlgA [Candidatus Coatesbacteria bacterium]|nr:flagellar basal body P-ring formation protein FlgA [Candidatus Coatesbacteria bacterium]
MFNSRLTDSLFCLCIAVLLAGGAQAAVVSQGTIESIVREKILSSSSLGKDEITIEFVQIPKISVPGEKCRLQVRQQNSAAELGRLSFAVTALGDGGVMKKYWVTANVSARTSVVCAARTLRAGSVIGPGDVLLREREIGGRLSQLPVSDVDLAIGKALKRGLPRGRILTTDMLTETPTVKKKSVVRLEVRIKSLRVATLGVALKDGKPGDVIPVQNASSQKKVYGVVQEDGTVLVIVGAVE